VALVENKQVVGKQQQQSRHSSVNNCELRQLGTFMWGATVEQPCDTTLTTGVDWKSITWPACLPITTDYLPDKIVFNSDYVVNQSMLVPDELNGDYAARSSLQKQPLSTKKVFQELISQRLAQGFQIIISPKEDPSDPFSTHCHIQHNVFLLYRFFFPQERFSCSISKLQKLAVTSTIFT